MTWGEIESTPINLNHGQKRKFTIQETRQKELLGLKLNEKYQKRKRTIKSKRLSS